MRPKHHSSQVFLCWNSFRKGYVQWTPIIIIITINICTVVVPSVPGLTTTINYNADQKMPLSFDPDHKNAPSFCQIKKCSFCFDPNSEPKKKCFFFWFPFYWSRSKKKSFVWSGSKTYPFFLDVNQKFTSIFLIWMKKSFFYPDNFSLFLLKEIFDTDGLFNLVQ